MPSPLTFVLFGATGDLAVQKIFPALDTLLHEGELRDDTRVIAVSRRNWNTADFRTFLKDRNGTVSEGLLTHIEYVDVDFDERRGYRVLKDTVGESDYLMIYLSLAPQWFPIVIDDLKDAGILQHGATKLLLEKPFGTNEQTARALNAQLSFLNPAQIYRVDHYLGKAPIQALMRIHETSPGLREIISNKTVERILIELSETRGMEGRGASYDAVGAFRDVGQNHMLEMLAVLLAEYPTNTNERAWQDARAKVLEQLQAPDESTAVRRGQYVSYCSEPGVADESTTETAFEIETAFEKGELRGVPVTLRAGKKLEETKSFISVIFKDMPEFPQELRIELRPEQTIHLRFKNGKVQSFPLSKHEEAYQHVLADALAGRQWHFVGEREIIAAWRYTDRLLAQLARTPLTHYPDGQPW